MKRPSYQEVVADNRELRRENEALRRENDTLRKENDTLRRRVATLEQSLESAQRSAKRQAAPFSKGQPVADPKKPGRKPGPRYGKKARRQPPPPDAIDERHDVPLPDCCPHCGGKQLQENRVEPQYQTEIPRRPIVRQFDIHFGTCCQCGRSVQGRHPLQTSSAVGAAAAQLGPATHAAIAILNKELGLSHEKVSRCLWRLFGIDVSRAACAHSIRRTARRCQPACSEIEAALRDSPWVAMDETGWRVGARNAWLHVHVSEGATRYTISPRRNAEVTRQLLGTDWSGTMIHDGWSPYDRFTSAWHQQCLNHLQHRCEKMVEAAGGGADFPRQVLEVIQVAYAVRRAYRDGQLTRDDMAMEGLSLTCYLESLAKRRFRSEPNRRLAKHILNHIWEWFWFLEDPSIDATNWRGEHGARYGVVARKVWGGNRTWPGSDDQSVLMSVIRTSEQRHQDPYEYLIRTLCSTSPVPIIDPQSDYG